MHEYFIIDAMMSILAYDNTVLRASAFFSAIEATVLTKRDLRDTLAGLRLKVLQGLRTNLYKMF